tara:strand:+ start:99 stop:2342 length:2244 start_codon:yes stop_codon:yes gene_type:complete
MKTLTEKYRGVLNETFNKTQFVRDARMAMPNLISQFNGFEDTVSILKSKGMISEKADEKALKHHNLSDEAIRRGADIEIEEMGRMSQDSVSLEDQAKAKDKALANLIKDPLHYLNIMAGESSKVDKHDKPVEYAKGKEVDTFNGMKKVELKENYTKDTLIKALGSADDAFIQLRDGRELIIYNPNSNNDDNAAMWHDDTVFAVDQDGQEEEIDYRDITNAYLEGKLSEAEPIPTEPGQTKIGDDGKEYGVRASNHDRKMAMRKVIDALTITGDDKGFKVSTDQALEFIRTHKDDIFSGDIDTEDVEDIWMNYNEYESVNYETGSDFVQEIEIDEEEVEEAMTDQEMKDIEKYGQKDDIVKPYKPGAMFTADFDYEGMLEAGLKVRLNTPIDTLQAIFDSMTDVNYHTEASHLSYAIEAIQEKDKVEALDHLRNFRKEIKKTLVSFNEGVSPTRELAEGVIKETAFKSKTYGRKPNSKIAEGRRKKTKGGKVVTENDYETGGYVESMGPMFDKGVNFLIRAWEEWKMGPMTEPGMIEFAKKDVISYLETQFMVENLEEKKGKDLDGDGDVDGDDYKHAKDSAIKKALNKDEKLVKENLKSIISKVLEEGIVNEAATNKLADWGTSYETFPGVKPVVNSLENIVTEIEQFYDKIGDKIADTFSKTSEFKNEEGLNIGAFIAPSLESAFKQDLRPVVKGGFIKKVVLPKVKTITKREIDRYDVGVPDIGTEMDEEEKQTVYSAPVNGTLN